MLKHIILVIITLNFTFACTKAKTPKLVLEKPEAADSTSNNPPANSSTNNNQQNPIASNIPGVIIPTLPNPLQSNGNSTTPNPSQGQNTPAQTPKVDGGSASWSGDMSKFLNQQLVSASGQQFTLSQIQGSKKYLVVGMYKSDCKLCDFRAQAFNGSDINLFTESSTCRYIALVQGSLSSWSAKPNFLNNFVFQVPNSLNDLKSSDFVKALFGNEVDFPTTAVIDKDGKVLERHQKDLGPHTALSYCVQK